MCDLTIPTTIVLRSRSTDWVSKETSIAGCVVSIRKVKSTHSELMPFVAFARDWSRPGHACKGCKMLNLSTFRQSRALNFPRYFAARGMWTLATEDWVPMRWFSREQRLSTSTEKGKYYADSRLLPICA